MTFEQYLREFALRKMAMSTGHHLFKAAGGHKVPVLDKAKRALGKKLNPQRTP